MVWLSTIHHSPSPRCQPETHLNPQYRYHPSYHFPRHLLVISSNYLGNNNIVCIPISTETTAKSEKTKDAIYTFRLSTKINYRSYSVTFLYVHCFCGVTAGSATPYINQHHHSWVNPTKASAKIFRGGYNKMSNVVHCRITSC